MNPLASYRCEYCSHSTSTTAKCLEFISYTPQSGVHWFTIRKSFKRTFCPTIFCDHQNSTDSIERPLDTFNFVWSITRCMSKPSNKLVSHGIIFANCESGLFQTVYILQNNPDISLTDSSHVKFAQWLWGKEITVCHLGPRIHSLC